MSERERAGGRAGGRGREREGGWEGEGGIGRAEERRRAGEREGGKVDN